MQRVQVHTEERIPFEKAALSAQDQIALLEDRGLDIPDPKRAELYLTTIGYYRLSAYGKTYQSPTTEEFLPDISFDHLIDLYVHDRQIRLLMTDALERIEVAIRSVISNTLCTNHGTPFWFLKPDTFLEKYQSPIITKRGEKKPSPYENLIKSIERGTGKDKKKGDQNASCRHYYETYSSPKLPPSWIVIETLTMGTWWQMFEYLQNDDQKSICRYFGFGQRHFKGWARAVTTYRNACAHHERFWNRVLPGNASSVHTYTHKGFEVQSAYTKFAVTYYWLKRINPKSQWPIRLKALMDEWPLDIHTHMGFPKDWHTLPFWQVPPK